MIQFNEEELSALRTLIGKDIVRKANDIDISIRKSLETKLFGKKTRSKLYIDGAADLNNGISGIGGVVFRNDNEIARFSKHFGRATNNEAEYQALINGLKVIHKLNQLNVDIYSDSELVVKQINGKYKVKNERMIVLNRKVKKMLGELESWTISHISREKNSIADKLAKSGMREIS
jgi:ribonuclease HI